MLMKPRLHHTLPFALLLLTAMIPTSRAEPAKLDLQPADTVQTLLERQVGQVVELRLKAGGDKIGGKVEKVGTKLLYLSQLTGAEFFEAAVDLDSISAVVVRAKTK